MLKENINEHIKERLNYEWEKYKLNLMTASKEYVFEHSDETWLRKRLYNNMMIALGKNEFESEELLMLCAREDIIDAILFSLNECDYSAFCDYSSAIETIRRSIGA